MRVTVRRWGRGELPCLGRETMVAAMRDSSLWISWLHSLTSRFYCWATATVAILDPPPGNIADFQEVNVDGPPLYVIFFVCLFSANLTKPRSRMLLDFIHYITFPLTYVRKYCPMQINVKVHNLQKNTDTSSQAFEPKWRYVAPLKKKKETT